jgi:hypothetical protein
VDLKRREGGVADAARGDEAEVVVAQLEGVIAVVGDGDEQRGDPVVEVGREAAPGVGRGDDLDAEVLGDCRVAEAGDVPGLRRRLQGVGAPDEHGERQEERGETSRHD